jgi:deoxyribonuclease-4
MVTMVHASYLINLASPDSHLFRRSRRAFLDEAERCAALGVPYLVFHPGAHRGSGEKAGLGRIARALNWVDRRLGSAPVTLLLENTAGQGTVLGSRFEHLGWIRDRLENAERVQICLDTCHLLAAGYDFRTPGGYRQVLASFDDLVGLARVRAFHLNDSKRGPGSRVDRHEHIGRGHIGSRPFGRLLRDPRFRGIPMIIETPKDGGMDRTNLSLLRRLARC